jgi:peptidyl-prolyl cis-trans isomerase A (cyclophilin A)
MPALAQKVKLATSEGDIVIELDAAKAPKTVDNFLQYVKAGHYDGTVFPPRHRQLHDPGRRHDRRPEGKADPRPIGLESRTGLTNQRGTVAMARTNDPNSATAQFFINVKDNDFLNQPKRATATATPCSAR